MNTQLQQAPREAMSAPEGGAESAREVVPGTALLPGLLAWELLGGGNHCETWLAWSVDLWAPVSVKLPRPDEVQDADVWQDLMVEAHAHSLVAHPGFQRLWKAGLQEQVPHLVLDYVEGPSLATLLDQRVLTSGDVMLLGLQLASSLRYLHRRGLVHLDVKPSNVVVREGRAVLLDLGIVTPVGRIYPDDDAPGTPAYMSPELVDRGEVSSAADVFALGATLRELLADQTPAPGMRDLLDRMTSNDPGRRPDDGAVLHGISAELGDDSPALWPAWATTALERPVLR
jgi:serine/threonine protein kinase